jgi:hypothetical protein
MLHKMKKAPSIRKGTFPAPLAVFLPLIALRLRWKFPSLASWAYSPFKKGGIYP